MRRSAHTGPVCYRAPPRPPLHWGGQVHLPHSCPDRAFTCALLLSRKILSLFFKASSDIISLFTCQHREATTLTRFPPFDFYKSSTLLVSSPFALPVYFLYSPKHCLKFKYLFILLVFGCAPQHVGSHFPNQEPEPCPLHWKNGVVTTGWPGKCQHCLDLIGLGALLSQGRCLLKQMEQLQERRLEWGCPVHLPALPYISSVTLTELPDLSRPLFTHM